MTRTVQDLMATETIIRAVLAEANDFAIFLVAPDGSIETWSAGAERMFGYTAAEIVGQPFAMLFTPDDRAIGAPERELRLARESGRGEDTRWHLRKDGKRFFADGVTNPVRADDGSIIGYSKIQRDITDRYRTEQRLAAQLALTNVLNEDEPIREVARRVMQTICESLGWDIGILWDVDAGTGRMCTLDMWHAAAIDDAAAHELCAINGLDAGVGLPGRVYTTKQPAWVPDFSEETQFPRAPLVRRAGMRAAVAFPIMHDGRVTGVMEFFSAEQREPDQALLPVMSLIGVQVGDFIDRRRTGVALRESEERYRVVSETAQDAIFTIDASSTILFCNPAVERVFGWKPSELVGKPMDTLIPERFRKAHRDGIARFLRTRVPNIPWTGVELPGLHRDGHEIPLEISFGEWTNDDRTIFTGFARDITTQKRALEHEQQARAESEASRAQLERRAEEESSFRHLASALTGAVEMTDVLYEITNRATLVTRADGVYVERIIGADKTVEVVSSAGRGVPPRGLRVPFPGSMTEEIMRGRQPVILADMGRFGRSMAPYLLDTCSDCEVLVTPLIAEDESLGALVLLNSGASGRTFREADTVRARTLGDLTSLALRRVRLLEQEREAKEKAEAAVRVRDETLGIVSHDLRNPLTKISLSAELLSGASPEEQSDLIATILDASRQAQRLIQDLLDVARVEAGRFSVDASLIDAEELVRDACASHERLAALRKQKIVCSVEAPLPPICADRDRILQVFGNLIGNAVKFTPQRGTITVEATVERNAVRFRVSDNGPGIPETDLKQVFRPYWQAKKTAHMGAGLGLAIVRGIVEAHGGRVNADNAPGGGARFTFTIPTT